MENEGMGRCNILKPKIKPEKLTLWGFRPVQNSKGTVPVWLSTNTYRLTRWHPHHANNYSFPPLQTFLNRTWTVSFLLLSPNSQIKRGEKTKPNPKWARDGGNWLTRLTNKTKEPHSCCQFSALMGKCHTLLCSVYQQTFLSCETCINKI